VKRQTEVSAEGAALQLCDTAAVVCASAEGDKVDTLSPGISAKFIQQVISLIGKMGS
jgi:hypothetical protein